MWPRPRLADVGGVVVRLIGPRRWARDLVGEFGLPLPGRDPSAEVTIRSGAPTPPPQRTADGQDRDGHRVWWSGDDFWCQRERVLVHAERGPQIMITVAGESMSSDVSLFLQYALAWSLACAERVVLHAAVVASSGSGLLIVGRSGQGKSTSAMAALTGGWEVGAEDLAVVRATPRLEAQGFARDLMVPVDLVADSGLVTRAMDDSRNRAWVKRDTLKNGRVPLVGVVVTEHGTGDGHLHEVPVGERTGTLVSGLALPAFPPSLRAHLPMMARLAELPMWRLGHAEDPSIRMDRAFNRLAVAHDLATGA